MLKRFQVLIPAWLEEYLQIGVETYGFSHSEIIRLLICHAILHQISMLHPEYKPNLKIEDILKAIREASAGKIDKNLSKKVVSQIYFETRKAIEYRIQKLQSLSKD